MVGELGQTDLASVIALQETHLRGPAYREQASLCHRGRTRQLVLGLDSMVGSIDSRNKMECTLCRWFYVTKLRADKLKSKIMGKIYIIQIVRI